jgi:hypothetical protein
MYQGEVTTKCPKWRASIMAAEALGRFTIEDRSRAECWKRCLVGEMYGLENRDNEYMKGFSNEDGKARIHDLGLRFMGAVSFDDISRAKEIFQEITGEVI